MTTRKLEGIKNDVCFGLLGRRRIYPNPIRLLIRHSVFAGSITNWFEGMKL